MWRTAFALSALQLALHAVAAVGARDPRMMMPHAVAWLHDLTVLMLGAASLAGLIRLCGPALGGPASRAARGALVAMGVLLAVYPQTLQVFLAAPANLFDADAAAARVFVRDYLGIRALWPAVLALGVGALAPLWGLPRVPGRWRMAGIALALPAAVTLGRESPNPVVFGVQDSARQWLAPRTVPRVKIMAAPGGVTPRTAPVDWSPAARASPYDRVILAVLEGVTGAEFETAFTASSRGFFALHRGHARYFSRYYCTNLDSYTSLVAMTTSILVPFRAYAAPGRWASVNREPNLVRDLRGAGFRSLFVSTYEHQPFVPNPQEWDQVLDRRGLGDLSGFLSLGSNRMEKATEDRAALPAILEFVQAAPKSLVLAELVFGHSPEWRARTGTSPVDYYDRYLTELWSRLEAAELAPRTLLVVVSDHGHRSRSAAPDNYRVPLLLVGDGVQPGEDGAFRSHLDLREILAHYLAGTEMPPPRTKIFTVGSTERWIYGEIRAGGEHLFIDEGRGRAVGGGLQAAAVHQAFQAYVASFLLLCPASPAAQMHRSTEISARRRPILFSSGSSKTSRISWSPGGACTSMKPTGSLETRRRWLPL
jgi:hypothetical protein